MADIITKVVAGLNTNSGAIIALATVVLVGVTIFYAWVTRQMRLDAQKPNIAIYPVVRRRIYPHVDLYVQNIGPGTAYDVKFPSDLSFKLGSNPPLEEALFLRHGIGYLLPGQRREYNLNDSPPLDFNDLTPRELKIVVTYKDSMSKKYERRFCIKFREYID